MYVRCNDQISQNREISSHPSWNGYYQKDKKITTNGGKDVDKGETLFHC
jgi:hypothetical protein